MPRSASNATCASNTMVAVMQPATSMSRLANCPPRYQNGCASSATSANAAIRAPHQRRSKQNSAMPPPQAASSEAARAAHSRTPNRRNASPVIQ